MAYKHYRRPGKPSDKPSKGQDRRPAGKKGALSFFFSFYGSISKELFIGAQIILALFLLAISSIFNASGIENNAVLTGLSAIQIVVLLALAAIGYKRAHALGMSGFYSLVGTSLFAPFFMFWRPANDYANDGAFGNRFGAFRKIGAFFSKNAVRGALYLIVVYAASIAASMCANGGFKYNDMTSLLAIIFAFNLIQLPILRRGWTRKYYAPAVKVLSFAAYNVVIIGVTMVVAYMQLMMQLMRSIGPAS